MRVRVLGRLLAVLAAAPPLFSLACGQGPAGTGGNLTPTPTPGPGLRTLSLSADPRLIPTPTVQDYLDAFNQAKSAGVRGQFLSYTWSALEPTNGQLSVGVVGSGVSFDLSYGIGNKILLGIQCINTTTRAVPADLATTAWDSPAMESRFHALIDALAARLPAGSVSWLSVGNEVDPYLTAANEWSSYQAFYDDAVAYIHARLPGTGVGVTFTFDGANGPANANFRALTTSSDAIVFTYYPLGANFAPRGPASAVTDLPAMVSLAAGKPVVVQEFGYPSDSQYLGSSESDQADFFANGLATWSGIGGTKVPFLNVFLMHDFTPALCTYFAQYYGLPNSADFEAYLCSLGLIQDDGTDKAAWTAFTQGAAATGLP